jgi:hypothetical protein
MMYLANNTRPDIAYAVHQAARFTHHPRQSQAVGVPSLKNNIISDIFQIVLFQ